MITISLAMIVKNEEENLKRCLQSVHDLVDEINILDTGSADMTKKIAHEYTDRVYDFKWIDDFAAARNKIFSKATQTFILWMDADDVLLEADREKLRQLKRQLTAEIDAVSMFYNVGVDNRGNVTFSFRRNRLVNRMRHFQWKGRVHEYIDVSGRILPSDICVTHLGKKSGTSASRNLKIYEHMLEDNIVFTPRDMYYYANECFDHRIYQTAADYYLKFLQTNKGWSEDCINACLKLADIYSLKGDRKKSICYSIKSFVYDTPRAEHCCRLGANYLAHNEVNKAIFWYKLATQLNVEEIRKKGGFVDLCYYTWFPHVQLCVCYDRLRDYKNAKEHHEKAKAFDPENKYVRYNERYFKALGLE